MVHVIRLFVISLASMYLKYRITHEETKPKDKMHVTDANRGNHITFESREDCLSLGNVIESLFKVPVMQGS